MKKIFLFVIFIIINVTFIACDNNTDNLSTATIETIPVTILQTLPPTTPEIKGDIKMSNEEKKEKIGTIKEKIDIDFPSSMQILEINVNITQNKFYTIDAVFKVSKEEINAIYKQLNEEMQLYKWHKWLKNEPYFPKIWLELVEGREDYDFFDKAVPNSGKGANQMFFLVVPSEVDTSYTIYISYFGE